MKIFLRVCLKYSNDLGGFKFDWAIHNQNIAENSFSLGHGTDSRQDIKIRKFGSGASF